VVEEFGLLDCAYPGRLDLGLGRTRGTPRRRPDGATTGQPVARPAVSAEHLKAAHSIDGVVIPAPPSLERLRRSPRLALARSLLQQPDAITPGYTEQIADILALLRGEYRSEQGLEAHVTPGEGAGVQVWVLGSGGGESAEVAGHNSLRFAANYHVNPAGVLDAVAAYRAAFRPGAGLPHPHVCVSVDVVVAEGAERARQLAAGYGLWVLGIRSGEGAIPFPTYDEARAHAWTDEERELVADRIPTQIVGSPRQVVEQLDRLVRVTGADELAVTTVTHDHTDRVRSYELLAEQWAHR
jgi:luciferase family oxidoreductase group 1